MSTRVLTNPSNKYLQTQCDGSSVGEDGGGGISRRGGREAFDENGRGAGVSWAGLVGKNLNFGRERAREILSLSAFLGTEDIGVHIVYLSRVIITYT